MERVADPMRGFFLMSSPWRSASTTPSWPGAVSEQGRDHHMLGTPMSNINPFKTGPRSLESKAWSDDAKACLRDRDL